MSVILDRPAEAPPPTVEQPEPQRPWWRRHAPWQQPKTRNAAPADDGELLLDNATDESWTIALGYRDLGPVAPRQRRQVRVVKSGMLTARQSAAPVGYLVAHLSPAVHTVQIRRSVVGGTPLYDLRLLEGGRAASAED